MRSRPFLTGGDGAAPAAVRDAGVLPVTSGDVRPLLAVLAGEQSLFARDMSWLTQAVCSQTDAELFHPRTGGSLRDARRICAACPVTAECLEWALDIERREGHLRPDGSWEGLTWGMFGGLGPGERAGILKREHMEASSMKPPGGCHRIQGAGKRNGGQK